jgi:hypothetical protein
VNQVATLEGTCDNLKDCAGKAKKQCNNHGPALKVEISSDDTQCSFECSDGTKVTLTCPPPGSVASDDEEYGDGCELVSPPPQGCIEAEIDLVFDGARDDLHLEQYEVTELGVMSMRDALLISTDFEGVIFRTVTPAGTCDDVEDCATKANKECSNAGYGKAKSAKITLDGTSCSYTCTGGGFQGEIVCAKAPGE